MKGLLTEAGKEVDRIKGEQTLFSELGNIMDAYGKQPAGKTAPVVGGADDPERRAALYQGSMREFMQSADYKRI
ncbi:hypothetical protein ACI3PL_31685, partial [Lacticaseibacillus paracasei]